MFQQICSFIHKENVFLKIIASNPLVCLLFDYAYSIRLYDVNNMAASIRIHLQIFKRLQLLGFSTDLDETGIKIHGFLRSLIKT